MTDDTPPAFLPGDDLLSIARRWADHLRPGVKPVDTGPSARVQHAVLRRLIARAKFVQKQSERPCQLNLGGESFCCLESGTSLPCVPCQARAIAEEKP